MCSDLTTGVRRAALEQFDVWFLDFRPSEFFLFFSWGEIRAISPRALAASCLLVVGW
jgi:hypothetical protein